MITALIPAHNEEDVIADAVASLLRQTVVPDRVVVVADNCTDSTVETAISAGAEVFITENNEGKKAGALNQSISYYLADSDYILTQDADTILVDNWVENALLAVEDKFNTGAVSGRYSARDGKGVISLLQKIEYEQVNRRISRGGGKVYVLSGTATLFKKTTLIRLLNDRGYLFDEKSLTEDFEITLALKQLGFDPRTNKSLVTITDVMESWEDLYSQRLRWQRGTLDTLRQYGLGPVTKKLWFGQLLSYMMTLVFGLIFFAWGATLALGVNFSPVWLLVIPIFILSQVVETKRLGLVPTLFAASLVPMWLYDAYRLYIYWVALFKSVLNTNRSWV